MQNKIAQAQKVKGGQEKRTNTTVKGNHQLHYVKQHLHLPCGPKFLFIKHNIDSLSSSLIYDAFLQHITTSMIQVRPNIFAVY